MDGKSDLNVIYNTVDGLMYFSIIIIYGKLPKTSEYKVLLL